jgi:hypothetical protein
MVAYTFWINGFVVMGVAGMMALSPGGVAQQVDTVTVSAFVPADKASNFMVVDHENARTCIVALHRAEGYDIHRVEPANCDGMPAELAAARTWQDTPAGDVRITDHHGKALMTLAAGDGFAWEVVEPRDIALSFEAY